MATERRDTTPKWGWEPGKIVGSYRIARLAGVKPAKTGDKNEDIGLYVGNDLRTSKQVFIKRQRREGDPKQARDILRHEAYAYDDLHGGSVYPGICQPIELYEVGDAHCLVLPYIGDRSLKSVDPYHELPLVAEVLPQLAETVQHIHNRKILHLDIKPHNFVLKGPPNYTGREDPIVQLVDLECARRLGKPHPVLGNLWVGTPGYAPPEQVGQDVLTTKTDVFGLGATMFYLVTGRPPFTVSKSGGTPQSPDSNITDFDNPVYEVPEIKRLLEQQGILGYAIRLSLNPDDGGRPEVGLLVESARYFRAQVRAGNIHLPPRPTEYALAGGSLDCRLGPPP